MINIAAGADGKQQGLFAIFVQEQMGSFTAALGALPRSSRRAATSTLALQQEQMGSFTAALGALPQCLWWTPAVAN